ncbi:hypothetical protein KB879_26460 [Cupriavidus sp. KK10]|uniref:hypothetical protein n=1 Tax=Cupriavidus sp. KK10 TaxID=1478019 RepID=UPI001BA46130|nr:hypothetical protein [Cupriavidus sp. KK10]QUN27571.1 hypothetical protein KB879_26460 [Cupriavidus sp. KK10]
MGTDLNQGLSTAVGVRVERRSIFDMPRPTLVDLFGLSPAEVRLCRHLVAGLTIDDCGEQLFAGAGRHRGGCPFWPNP